LHEFIRNIVRMRYGICFRHVVDDSSGPDALQVVVLEDNHTFTMNEENLKRLLLDPSVRDNKVIMLSIAGAFRTGKSLLLDFFLRHLYAKVHRNIVSLKESRYKLFM